MTSSASPSSVLASPQATAGKYLTFLLGPESYGIQVLKVREIIQMQPVTAVPQMPAYVKGVINLRGKIVPVMDLRLRFGLPEAASTDQTCILVVQLEVEGRGPLHMGLVVDAVEEVLNLAAADIEAPPRFGNAVDTTYLLGMAKVKGAVKTLLDIDRVVAGESIA